MLPAARFPEAQRSVCRGADRRTASTQTELHSRRDTLIPATPRGPGGRCAQWEMRTRKDERCAPPDHRPREPPGPPTERPVLRNPKTRMRSLLSVFPSVTLCLWVTPGDLCRTQCLGAPLPWFSGSYILVLGPYGASTCIRHEVSVRLPSPARRPLVSQHRLSERRSLPHAQALAPAGHHLTTRMRVSFGAPPAPVLWPLPVHAALVTRLFGRF